MSFRNTISVSDSLDPNQAQHNVEPDLGLRRYHQTIKASKFFF